MPSVACGRSACDTCKQPLVITNSALVPPQWGASPKWVLARYQLHDAAARLEREPGVPIAAVVADAGYFDQAHFDHEFKALLGLTPAQYAAQCHNRPPAPPPSGQGSSLRPGRSCAGLPASVHDPPARHNDSSERQVHCQSSPCGRP
jgi:hypothetical protein